MNHVSDWLTHIDNPEDIPYLRSKLLDVNMRLFKANAPYHQLIWACCSHIELLALSKFDGYSLPYGMSGANAAIPFNIICIVQNRGKPSANVLTMLNPRIINTLGGEDVTKTNCGSIRLKKSIKVKRWKIVQVRYFNAQGQYRLENFYPHTGSYTIQHEIDHNLGILITDKEIK